MKHFDYDFPSSKFFHILYIPLPTSALMHNWLLNQVVKLIFMIL